MVAKDASLQFQLEQLYERNKERRRLFSRNCFELGMDDDDDSDDDKEDEMEEEQEEEDEM